MYKYKNINAVVKSDLGDRNIQQDYIKLSYSDKALMITVCDGMGGMLYGEIGSKIAADTLDLLFQKKKDIDIPDFYLNGMHAIDAVVYKAGERLGVTGNIGTTIASICIQNDKLYWLTVGDSRIYIIRDGQIEKTNVDHNYFSILDTMDLTQLSPEEYESEMKKGNALISYIGMNGVEYYSINSGLTLNKNDIVLITTDGLYKSLSEECMYDIISSESDLEKIADLLFEESKKAKNRDNTSFVIVKVES